MEIADTLDTIMQYETGPTTVQVDYRVTRSLTMCTKVGIIISAECSLRSDVL